MVISSLDAAAWRYVVVVRVPSWADGTNVSDEVAISAIVESKAIDLRSELFLGHYHDHPLIASRVNMISDKVRKDIYKEDKI